jgi:hypothetical protein
MSALPALRAQPLIDFRLIPDGSACAQVELTGELPALNQPVQLRTADADLEKDVRDPKRPFWLADSFIAACGGYGFHRGDSMG